MAGIPSRLARTSCAWAFVSTLTCVVAVADDVGTDQVTITARRLTLTAPGAEAAREDAERTAGGVNVVSSEDYADGRASNLQDVFAFAPGVFAQSRFGAEEARLSIRGSGLQRTFHMRGIQLLQDGVPITLADGGGDFQAVEPLALAYTEVMRGANALQYGGSTLGGSINFVSPSGRDGGGLHARIDGGSFDYARVSSSWGDAVGNVDYFASLSAYEQDGYRDWAAQENVRFFGNVGTRVSESVETRFYVGAVRTDSQLPGSLTKAALTSDPERANAGSVAGRQKRDFDLYRLANRTTLVFDDKTLDVSLGYSAKQLWHPIFQVLAQQSDDYVASIRYVDESVWFGRANRLIVGLTPSWNYVKDDRFVNIAGRKGARTAESRQRSENVSLYAQNEVTLASAWTIVGGVQWTSSQRELDDLFLGNGDQSVDADYSMWSPKLGLLWRPAANWSVYANVSDSFEPPSFGELAGGVGVDLLDAQSARTVELGSRGTARGVRWDISAYTADVRDELLGLNSPTGQPLGTVNAPRTLRRGVELGLDVPVVERWTLRSVYMLNDFRFDGNPTYGDRALPGLPKHFYRGELVWAPAAGYAMSVNREWSPQRYAVDMANTLFADAYAIWGVKLSRRVESGISWYVEGRNLGDRKYASSTGVIADARALDSAQFMPGDGRAVYVGLEWGVGRP